MEKPAAPASASGGRGAARLQEEAGEAPPDLCPLPLNPPIPKAPRHLGFSHFCSSSVAVNGHGSEEKDTMSPVWGALFQLSLPGQGQGREGSPSAWVRGSSALHSALVLSASGPSSPCPPPPHSYVSPCFFSYVGCPLWVSEQLSLSPGLGLLTWNIRVVKLSVNNPITPAAASLQDSSVRAGLELADSMPPWAVSLLGGGGRGQGKEYLPLALHIFFN